MRLLVGVVVRHQLDQLFGQRIVSVAFYRLSVTDRHGRGVLELDNVRSLCRTGETPGIGIFEKMYESSFL